MDKGKLEMLFKALKFDWLTVFEASLIYVEPLNRRILFYKMKDFLSKGKQVFVQTRNVLYDQRFIFIILSFCHGLRTLNDQNQTIFSIISFE